MVVPLHFVFGMNCKELELLPKTVTRMDEHLQGGPEGLLQELETTALKNSRFERTWYLPSNMWWWTAWPPGGLQEGELIMKKGNYKNVGQGEHLGMLWVISAQLGGLDYMTFNTTVWCHISRSLCMKWFLPQNNPEAPLSWVGLVSSLAIILPFLQL